MKKIVNFIIYMFAMMATYSCQMLEGEDVDGKEYGNLQLTVEKKLPGATRANGDVNTSDFEVAITNNSGFKADYVVSNLPNAINLTVGNYNVVAHTPGEIQKKMSVPYFYGEEEMSIEAGLITQTTVKCKQQNSKMQVNFGSDFRETYSSWVVTIDDGNNSVLVFDEKEDTPNTVYWLFDEGVKSLTLNLTATPRGGGNVVKGRMTIDKASAAERYDDDKEEFGGGDAIVINIGLVDPKPEPTAGKGNIKITVDATFENHDESVEIPVDWQDGDEVKTGAPTIVFTAEEVSATAAGGPELNATIEAASGLKSVKVKAVSTGGFAVAMEDLEESGLRLKTGHELIGDEMLPSVFEGLGVEATMPNEGDKIYVFNIANFYQFLAIYGASETTFHITVTDMEGNVATGSVLVKITE